MSNHGPAAPKKLSFEAQLTRLSLTASLPLFCLLIPVMFYAGISIYLILLTILLSGLTLVYCHVKIHQKSAYQFRSLTNILEAMLQDDYSLRARSDHNHDALNELVKTINGLAQKLNRQRIETAESQLLLQTVINNIDVAIVALNDRQEIMLSNPASDKLLGLTGDNPRAKPELLPPALLESLQPGQSKVMPLTFGQRQGRYKVHMEAFRETGLQHRLLFLTDVSSLLRNEERNAWQSLVRVISHEINNSLAPIASISQTLTRLLTRQQLQEAHKENLLEGLSIISQRSQNLKNFVNSYKQIARLPEPDKKKTAVTALLDKITPLFQEQSLAITPGADIELLIDPVQMEQVLINLLKNAQEAMHGQQGDVGQEPQAPGKITISWQQENDLFILKITDEGTGISNPENLFVPFYTTKKQGSGIGLGLCRQILEMHQGKLSLDNRNDKTGCVAVIELPLTEHS
ncbi:GHKL domain-containing protein [Thalassomonas viridans]|uniref:histidine kinase n=1 Tax=Thalassomonas viridans TaxID=137584 RepID=A0AAE9Z261_9GAMM|nr:ATP-binding protein [Thalassomonas viridans]WDE03842.1 GHKL domain-containing protein [Thalassomonas viridans]